MQKFLETFKAVQASATRTRYEDTRGDFANEQEVFVLNKFAKAWAKHEVNFEARMYSHAELEHIVNQTARCIEMHPVFDQKLGYTGEEIEVVYYEKMDDYERRILMNALIEQAKIEEVYSGNCAAIIVAKYGRLAACGECKNCEMNRKFYARMNEERHERDRLDELKNYRVNLIKNRVSYGEYQAEVYGDDDEYGV